MTESWEIAVRDTTSKIEMLRKAAQRVCILLRLRVAWFRMGLIGLQVVMGIKMLMRGLSLRHRGRGAQVHSPNLRPVEGTVKESRTMQ